MVNKGVCKVNKVLVLERKGLGCTDCITLLQTQDTQVGVWSQYVPDTCFLCVRKESASTG